MQKIPSVKIVTDINLSIIRLLDNNLSSKQTHTWIHYQILSSLSQFCVAPQFRTGFAYQTQFRTGLLLISERDFTDEFTRGENRTVNIMS